MSRSGKQGPWELPVVNTPKWGKLGPAFGYGLGCGVGLGAGLVGGMGLGIGLPGVQFGFGLGGGCGIGIGFGYGLGKGRAYDSKNNYSNVGITASQRRGKNHKNHNNAMADTEIGRLVGDILQELTEFAAKLGPK